MPDFAKHLPPSAGLPRVLALDDAAQESLPSEIHLITSLARAAADSLDAVVGYAPPDRLPDLARLLRPGGRLILAHTADPARLLNALTAAGLIHCLVESFDGLTLYRGERPPVGSTLERLQSSIINSSASLRASLQSPFLFLLITQIPNRPAWRLSPDEKLEWRATTILNGPQPALLAFTSLVKAVAFMQKAVLAKMISGINKVGKFPASAAPAWELPLLVNPDFETLKSATLGPPLQVDPAMAIRGDE
jgi:hypothetical protein